MAIQTHNDFANGIANGTVKQRRSKAMEMRFVWICDSIKQLHVLDHWKPGLSNQADYFTKNHSLAHHQTLWCTYLQGNAPILGFIEGVLKHMHPYNSTQ
jgi:hypothetical protein